MSGSPLDNSERLAALERSGLLDSPPEAVFDALIELARDLLGGTAALVSLVDDSRQFFKAQVGLGEPWASARQTPLSHSFCQHVVTTNAPLLVSNSRLDARVQGNGAIDDLGVTSYAGVPLVDEDKHTLGALCVVDGQPREWTEKEVRTLKTLAKAVMAEVHLRHTLLQQQQQAQERERLLHSLQEKEGALRQALERTRQVMDAARAGLWDLDTTTGVFDADARTLELMGLPPDRPVTVASGLASLEPHQAAHVAANIEAALRGENGGHYHVEFRTGGRGGLPTRWVESRAQAFFDTGGKAVRFAGVNVDITARKVAEAEREEALAAARWAQGEAEAERERLAAISLQLAEREQLLRMVVEGANMSAWSMDCRTRLITADHHFLDLYGVSASKPVPLSAVLERVHPEDRPRTERAIEAALAGEDGGRYLSERRIRGSSGAYHWGETRGQVTFAPDGTPLMMHGVNFNVSMRKEAEVLREELLQRTRDEGERQQLMFEQAPASIALLEGPEHRFRVANARCRQWVGHREIIGRSMAEILPEAVGQGLIALLDTVCRTGEPHVGRETWLQLRRRPGGPLEDVCLDFVYQPIRDGSGHVDSIFLHAVEITDLVRSREGAQRAFKEMEALAERLRRSEARLALALDASSIGLWEMDLGTGTYIADARFREMFGLTHDEPVTREMGLTFLPPEERARVTRNVTDALAGKNGGVYAVEYRTGRRADESYRWVSVRGQAYFDPDGKAVRFAGTGLDITERKSAELAQTRLLRSLADQSVFGIAVLRGEELRFETVNSIYRQMLGGRDVVGKPFLEALPEFVGQGADTGMREVLHTGKPSSGRELGYHMVRHGGGDTPEERSFTFVWQPIFESSGGVESVLIITHDVTDQVRARRRIEALLGQLAASEERLRRAVEASGAGFWELDAATGRVTADARVMSLLGLTPGAPLNLELALACVYAEDREDVAQAVTTALSGEQGEQFLRTFRIAGLESVPLRWVENRGQRRLDAHGRAVALAGALLDITERKAAEEEGRSLFRALGDSEERYRLATRATKDAIWDWNLVTNGVAWNEGVREQFGFAPGEVRPDVGWWLEHVHPEDRARVSQSRHAVIDAPGPSAWSDTYRFQRRDGSWARVEDRGWVTRGASGRAVRMVGAMQDVTERKAAEEILARQVRHHALSAQVGLALTHNSALREMLQACAESLVKQLGAAFARVWLLNPQHDLLELYASAGLYTHLDGPHGRVPVGRYKIGLIAQERQPHLTNDVVGDPRVGDQEWARREGMKAFAGYPLLVGDKLVGVVALFSRHALASDTLDTLRLVADSIALGVERLRAEGELKTRVDFEQKLIGIVSHDLRNPLNAILLGATVLSQREVLDARGTKSLMRIHSAADRAARMVKDLLDFTQARLGGGLKVEPKPMDLHEVTRGVVEEVEAAWPGRELEVEHEGAAQVNGDADRLGQVVQNLVTNALKYSPDDSAVRVVTRGEEEGVSLSVFNGGAPIPEDKLESIFEPMQRATAEVDKTGRSVGLGLYIVKSIVAAHGGRISVTSSEVDGTVFTVSLPRTRVQSLS